MKVLVLAVLGLAIFENFVHCQINSIPGSGKTNFYLDRYSDCDGRPREVGNSTVFISGQSTELQGQPVTSCSVTLKTTNRVPYRFKLQVLSVRIDDPGVYFYIYDGEFQGRLLGSFSKLEGKPPSLNFIFTSGHLVTFRLTRGELERNFDLRIVVTPVPSSLPFYLDRYSDCDGRPREVGNSTVFISGQSTELQGQPVTSCSVTLKTTNRVPYRFKLQVINMRIDDPGVYFYIYDGEFQGRLLGSFSKLHGKPPSLNFIFTSGHLVTFRLTRGELERNFDIRIVVTPVPSSPVSGLSQKSVYLDRYSDCDGRPIEVGNSTVFISGQSTELQGQPVTSCSVTLKTTNRVPYRFKLQVINMRIDDPGVYFYIYDGEFQGRLLGSFSKLQGKPPGLNFIFTSGHLVTFRLTRGELERNFDIRILVTPVPSSLPYPSDDCMNCTKCREEYLVDGKLSPDCPEGCKSDQMDNDFMNRCGTTVLCAKKEGVQKCACTHQACTTSGSHTLKLPVYLLLSFLFAALSLKYLV